MYSVLRAMQMRFLPSLCAERGLVAETDFGTVGNGRVGASLTMRFRFDSALGGSAAPGGGGCTVGPAVAVTVDSLARFGVRTGVADSSLRLEEIIDVGGAPRTHSSGKDPIRFGLD